jgi:hypothetical protein
MFVVKEHDLNTIFYPKIFFWQDKYLPKKPMIIRGKHLRKSFPQKGTLIRLLSDT